MHLRHLHFNTCSKPIGRISNGHIFTALLIGTLYKYYRYSRANQKEKQTMDSQIQTEGHYYRIWYTPADSTELQYQKEKMHEKIRKKTKKLGYGCANVFAFSSQKQVFRLKPVKHYQFHVFSF